MSSQSRKLLLAALVGICLAASLLVLQPFAAAEVPDWRAIVGEGDGDPAAAAESALDEPTGATATAAVPKRETIWADGAEGARVAAADVLVQDAAGRPIEGAQVEARAQSAALDRRATDAAGRAVMMLPADEPMSLRATAEGHLPGGIAEHPFGQPATLRLVAAARVAGVVQDESGKPLADVVVTARGRSPGESRSDADGRFELHDLRPGTYDLALVNAKAEGSARFLMIAGLFLKPGVTSHTFVLPPGSTVAGVVRDATSQQPIAGAAVVLTWRARSGNVQGHSAHLEAQTDASGGYAFTGIAPGSIHLRAAAKAHAEAEQWQVLEDSRGSRQLDFALVGGVILAGRVVDVDQRPVAGADVRFGWAQRGGFLFGTSTTSGDDGSFTLVDLPVRDGALLVAAKDGHTPGATWLGKLTPGESRESLVIAFQRGVTVRGRLRDEDNRTVAGATLRLVPRHGADRYAASVTSGPDGSFVFERVPGFPYRLEVQAPDCVTLHQDVDVDAKKLEQDLGELRLRLAFTLEGVVIDRGAQIGQGGARVGAQDGSKGGRSGGTTTDEFGRFTIEGLPRGAYTITVHGPDVIQTKPFPVVTLPNRTRTRVFVDAMVPLGTGILEGRVLDAGTGKPLSQIQIAGVDGRRVMFADGAYSLRGIPAGRIDLQFQARGYQTAVVPAVLVVAGQTRSVNDVWLQPGGTMRLQVIDEKGKPFKAGQVRVELVDTYARTFAPHLVPAETNAEKGTFVWQGLALSQFELRVTGPGTHQPLRRTVDVFALTPVDLRVPLAPKPKPKPQGKKPGTPQPASGPKKG